MYYSNYYGTYYSSGERKERDLPYRTPYASNVIRACARQEDLPSYAGRWSVKDVISNRSAFAEPRKILLCVSDQCNFHCGMCTFRPGKAEVRMTLDDWERLVRETASANVVYTLFGGEPLLYKEIDALVKYMGEMEVQMNIVTNGSLLEKHLDVLMENKCRIILSIDGLGAIHDSIRGYEGSFEKLEGALAAIFGSDTSGRREMVSVNSVLLPENADGVEDFLDYLYGIGMSCVCFQHLQFYGEKERRATDKIWQDYWCQPFQSLLKPRKDYVFQRENIKKLQKAVEAIHKARQRYPDMGIFVYPDFSAEEIALYYSEDHEKLRNKSLCLNPWTSAVVNVDGTISVCLDACIGNYKDQNFWSAWYGQKAVNFRSCMTNHIFPVCTRCCNFYNSYVPE